MFKAFIYWRYRAFKNNSVHPESEKNPVKLKRIIHTNPEDTVHNQYIINGDRAILFDLWIAQGQISDFVQQKKEVHDRDKAILLINGNAITESR